MSALRGADAVLGHGQCVRDADKHVRGDRSYGGTPCTAQPRRPARGRAHRVRTDLARKQLTKGTLFF
jgi:hypothetical protein